MARKPVAGSGTIRVGVGGWSYAPWRGVFYPKGLKQADELSYATSKLTSIEINATHYRLQSPKSFRIWGATAPDGFVFSVKGPRLVTQQKALAETGRFVERFVNSGLAELGDKLGPILWQFAPFKRFDEEDFGKFLDAAAARSRWTEAQPRRRGSPCELQHAALCRARARFRRRHRLCRRRGLAEHRRSHWRRRLCATTARRRHACRSVPTWRTRSVGWPRQGLGKRSDAGRPSPARPGGSQQDTPARRVHLFHS